MDHEIAVKEITNIHKAQRYTALPATVCHYARLAIAESLTLKHLKRMEDPLINFGGSAVTPKSLSRVRSAAEAPTIPKLWIVAKPLFNLEKLESDERVVERITAFAVALDRQLLLMVSQLFDTCDDEVAKTHLDKIEGLIWLRNVDNVQPEPAKDKPRFAFIPQGFEFWMSLEVQMVAWKKGTK